MSDTIVDCPLCGKSPARLWAREKAWRVYECRGCALRLTWPRPSSGDLDAAYGLEYYESRDMAADAAPAWLERAQGILSSLPDRPQAVLDWGAGAGHFVAALRSLGFSADGVETAAAGRTMAKGLHSVELTPAPGLERLYDLICFVHSLEHIDDPVASLRAARAHLASRGRVFIEVPHAGSFEMWRPAVRRRILDLPVHLFHFTPGTLARVVEAGGLRTIEVRLFNAAFVEWLVQHTHFAASGGGPPSSVAAPAAEAIVRRGAASSGGHTAAALRRVCPGWKFQLLAEVQT